MIRTSVSNPPPITICTSFYDLVDAPVNAVLALEEDDEQDDDDEKREQSTTDIHETCLSSLRDSRTGGARRSQLSVDD
jgi:hypothetical protein